MKTIKNFIHYFKGYTHYTILAPLFKLLEACFELLVPLIVSRIIEEGIKKQNQTLIVSYFLVLIAFSIIGIICALIAQYFSSKCACLITRNMRNDLFIHYQGLSLENQNKITTSKIINLMNSDMNQIQSAVNLFLRLFLRAPIIVFGSLIMAFIISKKMALIFLSLIPILILLVYLIMTKSVPLFTIASSNKDTLNKKTQDNLTGFRVIRALNKEKNEIDDFNEVNELLTKNELKASNTSILLSPFTSFFINLGIIAILIGCSYEFKVDHLTQGDTVALYNYMSNILVEIIKLTNLFITITKGIASFKRINSVLEMTNKEINITEQALMNHPDSLLSFEEVSFRYDGANKDALTNLNFTIHPGETIGLIGPTGSGKSTILNLITRLNPPTQGRILFEGKNINDYEASDLSSKISICLQKNELFSGTIKENILMGKIYDEALLKEALTISEANNIIQKKENGVDSIVTKNGMNLSGGEKQRIALARSFIKHSDLLLLDDAFSSLDYLTDKTIRQNLNKSKLSKSIIITSQRISSIMNADKIIVMNDGMIEAIGTHHELLLSSPTYKKIYDLQFQDEKGENK